ncbi:MAG: hypothetical protein QOE35_1935 [Actinomycetota bacterium]
MTRIRTTTLIDAPTASVWRVVRDIASHPTWMRDAVAVRFLTDMREGVGTAFDCDTKVGPFRMVDRMEVTEWDEGSVIGITHRGLVTGRGRFTIEPARQDRTRFTWDERLRFPWWAGGPVGGLLASPVLRRIWRSNLRLLKAKVEAGPRSPGPGGSPHPEG